jgi:hypothetical protein
VAGLAPGTAVNLHGYASSDGDPPFNLALSCHRANALALRLRALPSAPTIREIFKHGGTPGLVDIRRAVWVETIAPTRPPPVDVTPPPATPLLIKVWLNAFIPMATVADPTPFSSDCFTGDSRGFSNAIHASSRTHQEIEFDASTLARTIDWRFVGTSHRVDCTTGAVRATATAPISELTNGPVARSGSEVIVHFAESASNPLVTGAPAIDAVIDVHIDPVRRTAYTTGEHDGFPAYEVYVTASGGAGVAVSTYDPRKTGKGPTALFPPMDESAIGGPVSF